MTVIDDAGAEARVLDRGKKDGFSLVLLVRDNRAQQRDAVLITNVSVGRSFGLRRRERLLPATEKKPWWRMATCTGFERKH